jgi:hypothetical protein
MRRWAAATSLAPIAFLVCAAPREARADDVAPVSPATLDVIRLKNGGLLRGTIVELVPGATVTVLLPTGETRKVLLSDTTFAGRAADEPTAGGSQPNAASPSSEPTPQVGDETRPKPYATIHAAAARVRLVGSQPGLTFHLQTGSAAYSGGLPGASAEAARGYSRLCTAPCSIELPAGYHRFGLSDPSGALAHGNDEIAVKDSDTVRGTYNSKAGVRTLGWLLIPAGIGAFAGLSAYAFNGAATLDCMAPPAGCHMTPNLGVFMAGILVVPVAAMGTFFLVRVSDTASLEVIPAGAAPIGPVQGAARRTLEGSAPEPGLTLRVRF